MKNYLGISVLAISLLAASVGLLGSSSLAIAADQATGVAAPTQVAAAPDSVSNKKHSEAAVLSDDGKEIVENPYGLDALWKGGDFVARGTLLILVIMSIGSWYIIVTKLYEQFKLERVARKANETFWTSGALPQAVETLEVGSA